MVIQKNDLDSIISTDQKPDFARIETEIGTEELMSWAPLLKKRIQDRQFKNWYECVNTIITYYELLKYLGKKD